MKNDHLGALCGLLVAASGMLLAQTQPLTTQSQSVGRVATPSQQTAQPASTLVRAGEQVIPNPSQMKEVEGRVGLLESERTWVIGLAAGLGIGIALVVWLRKDIVRTLVNEAFPTGNIPSSGTPPKRWYPNKAQWVVTWIATTVVSPLFVFLPWSDAISLRIAVATIANAVLFIVCFSDH